MELRIWQSFSCNNSSSYRLVARFSDPTAAADTAADLTTVLKVHAKEYDALFDAAMDETDGDLEDELWTRPTKSLVELGRKYGFTWKGGFTWGEEELKGDEPLAVASGNTLLVYHSYCAGFPKELKTYLSARGAAKIEPEKWNAPTASVLFKLPKDGRGKKLETSLSKLFAQGSVAENKYIDNWKTKPPWSRNNFADDESKNTAFFSDGKTAGFYIALDPGQIGRLKDYLAKNGVGDPSIRLCEYEDLKKFKAIARARCYSCDGALEYIDPRVNDIGVEQLACTRCGGMFDMSTILAQKAKRPSTKKTASKSEKKVAVPAKSTKKAASKSKNVAATAKPKKKAGAKKK